VILAACKTDATSLKQVDVSPIQSGIATAIGLTIVAASLTAPLANRMSASAPAINAVTCAENSSQLQMTLGDGTAHLNVRDGDVSSVLPDIRRSDFRTSYFNEMKDFWQTVTLPVTLVSGFDYISRSNCLVSGPVGFASGPRRVVSLCAPLGNGIFSYREPIKKNN
jgi:hypothetical protein